MIIPHKVNCCTCKKDFITRPWRQSKFCSRDCFYKREGKKRDVKKCLKCNKDFTKNDKLTYKFCSRECHNSYPKITKNNRNGMWKGDNASYFAIHIWMKNNYGKAYHCENITGKINKIKCSKKSINFDWANISDKYHRDISDWHQLCRICHRKFDKIKNLSDFY